MGYVEVGEFGRRRQWGGAENWRAGEIPKKKSGRGEKGEKTRERKHESSLEILN